MSQPSVTMKGKPIALVGHLPRVGQKAPAFSVVGNDLSEVNLSAYKGKTCVISVVPSLDTPVCDTQTRRFNAEASKLDASVAVLTISMDLPFAQKRWCGAAGIDRVVTLSDHRAASFGEAYGVLIANLRLLARAIFIVDGKGVLRYTQLVSEVTSEPNYDEALAELKKVTG